MKELIELSRSFLEKVKKILIKGLDIIEIIVHIYTIEYTLKYTYDLNCLKK